VRTASSVRAADDAHPARRGTGSTLLRRWTAGLPAAVRRRARRSPVAMSVVALAWSLGLASGSLLGPRPRMLHAVATGVGPLAEGRWWTPLTAMFWWGTPLGYLGATVLVLVAGGVAERNGGSRRTLGILVGTQVVGTLLAVAPVATGAALGGAWASALAGQVTIGIAPGALGLALAASSGLSALWRRRLRVVLVTGLVMVVAYSGDLSDVLALSAGLLGLLAGPWVFPTGAAPVPAEGSGTGDLARTVARARRRMGMPSQSETRVLVALLVVGSAVGPVVAALAQAPIGPLSVLQYIVLSPLPSADTVQRVCRSVPVEECRELQAQLRLSGVGPAIAAVVPVLLLLVVAEGLRRGRRAARLVGIGLNLLLAALGLAFAVEVGGIPERQLVVFGGAPGVQSVLGLVLPSLLPLLVAVLLVLTRRQFDVRAPYGTYRRLVVLSGTALVVVSVLFVGLGTLLAGQFDRPPSTRALLAELPLRFLPPGYLGEVEPSFLPERYLAALLFEWTGTVFWLVVGVGLLVAFTRPRFDESGADAARARALLMEHGGSDLGWLTTWSGHHYWFGPGERTAVAYRVIGSVALTTADPVGYDGDPAATVAQFASFCRQRGWTPAFYSVTAATRAAAERLGWSAVQVAEETVLPLEGLEFTGRKWQDVRTAINKAEKEGVTAEWIAYGTAPRVLTDQIRAISEEWVADKGMPEMGFTIGGLEELDDDAVRCLVAVDAERTVHGVTSWMPVYRDGAVAGWTLDFMRRRSDGRFRGSMEFLIASAARDLRDEGYGFLSLSGAPLAQVDRPDDGPAGRLDRVLDLAGRTLEPVYGFRSLLAFKAKFQPCYAPLYLTYPDAVALPAIGIAIGRAYLPDLSARQYAQLINRLRS
jgi:phosphatidylglycerol lysyltransferase